MLNFHIEKITGTYAETLQAIGVAIVAAELRFPGDITIADHGSSFVVSCERDPSEQVSRVSRGYTYVWENSKEPVRPQGPVLDYETAKLESEASKKASKKAIASLREADTEAPVVHPDLQLAKMLASMRKGWEGDRDLAKWLDANPQDAAEWARFRLGLGGNPPASPPTISNTQILNPISGKGVHAPKTEIRSAGSIPGQLIDPFSEWMKLCGLWKAMFAYRADDDFKFYVIEPADVTVAGLEQIRDDLSKLPLWGGVKLDIRATLETTRSLILHSDAIAGPSAPIKLIKRRRTPRQVITGLRQAYFKSLGTAAALMNDALMPLPEWFSVHNEEDARAYLRIIDEAIAKGGCLNSLQEKNSDDGETLQQYREWLLSGELEDLLEFHYRFAIHLMQRISRKEWAREFGTDNLSLLLTKSYKERNVTDIIENPGFQSVARALRNATIYALRISNMKREVRFGIAQKWKQKIKAGDTSFMAEVAEFVQDYNWETTHRLKGVGHSVTTEELNSLVPLVERHHAELVGALLLAYGYARAPKREAEQQEDKSPEE